LLPDLSVSPHSPALFLQHLMCAGLWCLVEGDTSCKTKLDPPLDGTECGADKVNSGPTSARWWAPLQKGSLDCPQATPGTRTALRSRWVSRFASPHEALTPAPPAAFQWCRAGECVSKTPIPEHVDGDWSPWGAWSMCSRTCGTGARFRQRKCDNPPPGPGGTHCPGASVEHAVCENLPCPKGLPSFRDQQCQMQDRLSSKKKGLLAAVVIDVTLVSPSAEKPCELYCSPLGKESPLLVADRVLDGTPCGPYETDLCVHGRCQKIGCDGIIGSAAKEDRCGVCSGDGRTCRVVKGDFSHSRGTGYIEAAVIPAGARRIRVVEDKPAHSFLGKTRVSGHGVSVPGVDVVVRLGVWLCASASRWFPLGLAGAAPGAGTLGLRAAASAVALGRDPGVTQADGTLVFIGPCPTSLPRMCPVWPDTPSAAVPVAGHSMTEWRSGRLRTGPPRSRLNAKVSFASVNHRQVPLHNGSSFHPGAEENREDVSKSTGRQKWTFTMRPRILATEIFFYCNRILFTDTEPPDATCSVFSPALRDSSKRSINSDWKIELPGEFQIAGTTVRYVRRGLWEKISAKGPTKIPLHLMVLLFHDQNYGIHYEYTVPVNHTAENQSEPEKPQDSLFLWTHSGWDGCSVQCGGGEQPRGLRGLCCRGAMNPGIQGLPRSLETLSLSVPAVRFPGERRTIVSCTRIVNKTTTLVNDSDCPQASRPEPQVRRCNSHPCQAR
ncbi:A disintegrin and metalloproteinase with thrombospondin motifs 17, partial [Galemys pyrenaicus]